MNCSGRRRAITSRTDSPLDSARKDRSLMWIKRTRVGKADVIRKLDDFPAPECLLVNLHPKVTAPLEVTLVDAQVVNVGEAVQQRWCRR